MSERLQVPAVNCQYGAPMGRISYFETAPAEKVHLIKLRITSDGYDSGGAYWGVGGEYIWWACSDEREIATCAHGPERRRKPNSWKCCRAFDSCAEIGTAGCLRKNCRATRNPLLQRVRRTQSRARH